MDEVKSGQSSNMTKKEKEKLNLAITHLMSTEETDGFNSGLDILLELVGKYRVVNKAAENAKTVDVWDLKKSAIR